MTCAVSHELRNCIHYILNFKENTMAAAGASPPGCYEQIYDWQRAVFPQSGIPLLTGCGRTLMRIEAERA